MANKFNSAFRLKNVIDKTLNESDSKLILEVWATVFEIQDENQVRKAAIVGEKLRWLYHELELLRVQISLANLSESLYLKAFSHLELAISNMHLSGHWNHARQYLGSDVILALAFFVEILPNEENQIQNESIEEIRNLLGELRNKLSDSTLPESLVTLIKHHIEIIENAISSYPIKGAKALIEAINIGWGEIIRAKEDIGEHKNKAEIKALASTWKKVNDVADAAIKFDKVIKIGHKAWEVIESYII
ncbi:MAG: hypothetical protein ACRCZ4_13870 [Plesiomonas sp.]|uniref:hypothetical protein n=1 Tax=Plesiomonas sp. TaxID=2486279 RepID=UPI003F2EDC83